MMIQKYPDEHPINTVQRFCGNWLPDDTDLLEMPFEYVKAVDSYFWNLKISKNWSMCGPCKFSPIPSECKRPVPDDEFYLFCQEKCVSSLGCKTCKGWGLGKHRCLDFTRCKTCKDYAEQYPLSQELLKDMPSHTCYFHSLTT